MQRNNTYHLLPPGFNLKSDVKKRVKIYCQKRENTSNTLLMFSVRGANSDYWVRASDRGLLQSLGALVIREANATQGRYTGNAAILTDIPDNPKDLDNDHTRAQNADLIVKKVWPKATIQGKRQIFEWIRICNDPRKWWRRGSKYGTFR